MRQIKIFEAWDSPRQLEQHINEWLIARPGHLAADEVYHYTVTHSPDPRNQGRLKYSVLIEYTKSRTEV